MKRKLTDWIESYLQYVENTEPPHLYKEWSALSAISATLMRKCYLQMGLIETFPNMFIVLVGPSGTGKSQAMRPARDLLREVGIPLAAERITREALVRELRNSYDHETTPDGKIIGHSSLTVHSSELGVFLGHQNNEFLGDLCDLYDCDVKWEFRTKDPTRADEVVAPYLNIIGGITPASLQARLPTEAIGGGLTSRMVCVYEEHIGKPVPMLIISKEEEQLRQSLVDDLFAIKSMSGRFALSESFIEEWFDWYNKTKMETSHVNPSFAGYRTRRPLHILKMLMIIAASESNEMLIKEKHFERALALLEKTEINMGKTFEGVGESRTGKIVQQVMSHIGRSRQTSFRELNRLFYADADKKTIEETIRQISSMGFCEVNWEKGTIHYVDNES